MRIMVDMLAAAGPEVGGGYTYISNLVQHLSRLDRDNEYLLLVGRADRGALPVDAPNFRAVAVPGSGRGTLARILAANLVAPSLAARHRVDVFFAPNDALPPGLRCRTVVAVQNLIYYRAEHLAAWPRASAAERWRLALQHRYYRHQTPRAVTRADRVIAISDETRREIVRRAPGLTARRVRVIYPGVASAFLAGSDGPHGDPDAERGSYVLAVGALAPYKNLDKLLAAFRHLEPERGGSARRLVLVGRAPYQTYETELRRLADRLGVAGRVQFRGFERPAGLARLYRGASVFVLLSACESFGFPLVEAMACGAPVVASNRSSIPEVIGDAGLTVDPDEVPAITDALRRVLGDDELRRELRRRSRERARRFSWTAAARDTRELFEEVTAAPRPGAAVGGGG